MISKLIGITFVLSYKVRKYFRTSVQFYFRTTFVRRCNRMHMIRDHTFYDYSTRSATYSSVLKYESSSHIISCYYFRTFKIEYTCTHACIVYIVVPSYFRTPKCPTTRRPPQRKLLCSGEAIVTLVTQARKLVLQKKYVKLNLEVNTHQ